MSYPNKRVRYDAAAAATAQYYNTTGTVPSSFQLPFDISYLITTQPNCTIVAFKLPPECTEIELRNLFSSYGPVKNMQIVCEGKAALIEYNDISLPTRLVHWAKINPFYIGMTHVRLEFSSQQITANNPNDSHLSDSTSQLSNILHLDITNADYPITVDVLKSICSPYGSLQRIFIGKKSVDKSVEALIEFLNKEDAKKALENLNGADIYSGCCNLSVTFSNIKKVHVTKNDTESWDFTDSDTARESLLCTATGQRTLLNPVVTSTQSVPAPPDISSSKNNNSLISTAPAVTHVITASSSQQSYYGYVATSGFPTQYFPSTGGYYASPTMPGYQGQVGPYGLSTVPQPSYFSPSVGYPMLPLTYPHFSQMPAQSILQILPTPAEIHHVTPNGIGIGHSTSSTDTASASVANNTDFSIFRAEEGAVLLASNLPIGVNCDHIFNILCMYGNVARVKFLKSRPGYAFIQMGSKESADFVFSNLDGVKIFGKVIQFHHSKQVELEEHAGLGTLADGSPVMKNYMSDTNNRFRTPTLAAKSRILLPTRTLHFYNAPLYLSPGDICHIFTNCGVKSPPRIVIFTTKPGQKTSLGLVEWDTLADTMDALALANHRPIHIVGAAHPFHLKLAFSPKPISPDRAGTCMINYPAPPIYPADCSPLLRQGFDFLPHTIVTMASPYSVSSSLGTPILRTPSSSVGDVSSANTDKATDGVSTPGDESHLQPAILDVEELEAEESVFLAKLATSKVKSDMVENPQGDHTPAQSVVISSDSEKASLRQPTTPPSETEDT